MSARGAAAKDIRSFELRRDDGGELPEFTAGSHISLRVPNGLIRKYSLCNDPAERDRYVIAVLREPAGRGGSVSLVDDAKDGDEILIAPPRNDFPLVKSPAGYTFIAGGIGITPIMSMIRHLKSSGAAGSSSTIARARRSRPRSATSSAARSFAARSSSITTAAISRARSISGRRWSSPRATSIAAGRAA